MTHVWILTVAIFVRPEHSGTHAPTRSGGSPPTARRRSVTRVSAVLPATSTGQRFGCRLVLLCRPEVEAVHVGGWLPISFADEGPGRTARQATPARRTIAACIEVDRGSHGAKLKWAL